ncbi:DNA ligase 3 [Coccinella septempunctata]|uniref:DNA ligase 3 n=1 Tax=Coccinella septempunctata TaxID=41139 RepID=UPI001D05C9E0|nr:DNA ligase 3 [Coccinella septempunctata]
MSQSEDSTEKEFCVEIAKQGRATCKKCKQKCQKDEVRIAKLVHNPFGEGKMKNWHHVECLFEVFLKQRPTTKRIESSDDIDGFDTLPSDAQDILLKRIETSNRDIREKYGAKVDIPKKPKPVEKKNSEVSNVSLIAVPQTRPYPFKDFRRLVAQITNVNGYLEKTEIVSNLFKKGTDGNGFHGDIHLWCRLLLPGVLKRIYNLQSKQLVKIFSRLFKTNQTSMLEHLEQGDIGETIQQFYEASSAIRPAKKSNLTVEEVDVFLEELSKLTKEEEQIAHFLSILKSCTSNDLKIIIRLIKHDLRMNAGAKHILEGVHPDAYTAYQSSRDLGAVLEKCLSNEGKPLNATKGVSANINVMTPVLPMLAEACKSVEMAMDKCPNGMYSEIKYDGERVQVHKKGSEFKYFSRSLKPVMQHKIAHFKDYIPKAFVSGNDLILDSEILMIDIETQAPLPFGSLGKHKRDEYENASVCLYIFDCLYYNGEDLTKRPIDYRKKILRENMTEVKNHIVFSESKIVKKPSELKEMMIKVFKLGLEGLVLKDLKSIYEPGKRHWLKVKKDYLFDGAMADTADLIVLGAWYGTGKKGGKMSVFLMGCYDEKRGKFYTVTKVHTGLDDKTLDDLQNKLDMIKISSNPSKVPDWLVCNRPMVPDFVAKDPMKQPVWEITGAEFTQHEVHTADGISIRFPRITKMRDDKDWKTATSLQELKKLYEKSKEHTDVTLLLKGDESSSIHGFEPLEKSTDDLNNTTESDRSSRSNSSSKELNNKKKHKDRSEAKKKRKTEEGNLNSTNNTVFKESPKKRKHEESPEIKKKQKTDRNIRKDKEENNCSPYFQGVRLYLEEEVENLFKNWDKNFSWYGGVLLKSNESHKATHVLHMNRFVKDINRSYPTEAKHVLFSWIDDTVRENCLQDYRLYSVKWRPDL